MNQIKTRGGDHEEERMGTTPKLMAHGQIMKVMNEGRKPEKLKRRKQQRDKTRNPLLN